ncbi:kinesin-like protein KIF20A [Paramacrobiotus metropolitanus]|uniref:kinesin-like protein KIF20A n=1 Tax=Paramacrobiotus metropolitanus TaxID=2943436 RepID=UPI002445EBBC|nr:kinesin-like protein KIF20A [Paramacrobiotus metropolitanus]XP_055327463.1 kinesin-like protein KIF20A [Paramacrobiotus metropolitanus]XP_055327464.1 kinesin-like protein KIF20A [Paramacrobiotus metropolitanus]XP_055327465.1 kinesin-like protein KIF20A [Paramacrobiotus metropolitanus]
MPKTKAASATRAKKTTGKKIPSLASLSASAGGGISGHSTQQLEEKENVATPSAPGPNGAAQTPTAISTTYSKKNLRELFSAEETIVEDISLRSTKSRHGVASAQQSENMEIFLRVRPFLPHEIKGGENKNCFALLPKSRGIALNPPVSSYQYRRLANSQNGKVCYEFTRVLADDMTQKDVFEMTMRKPIQQFLCGTSQLIFTYGVTNSGKTYTLLGPRSNQGILPRALERIFSALGNNVTRRATLKPNKYEDIQVLEKASEDDFLARRDSLLNLKIPKFPKVAETPVVTALQQMPAPASDGLSLDSHGFFDFRPVSQAEEDVREDRDCIDPDAQYYAWVSYVEIYEDVMYDLLESGSGHKSGRVLRSGTLKLCDEGNTCYPKGVVEVPVFSASEAYHILGLGRKNLHVAQTKLNEYSSRSHSVFTIKLIKSKGKEASVTQLAFCDLAGTERANRTENIGTRLKESQNINKDLHHLKECIEALRKVTVQPEKKKGRKKDLVPYRNCKLTRLFRSFFSGKGSASMIVNISQCVSDFDETVQAIRFGSSALRIMIPMTRRESILLQVPDLDGIDTTVIQQNVVSVKVREAIDDYIEEDEEEEEEADSEEESLLNTVKKQPRRPQIGNTTVVLSKALEPQTDPNATVVKKPAARKGSTGSKTIIKKRNGTMNRTWNIEASGEDVPQVDTTSESSDISENESGLFSIPTDSEAESSTSEIIEDEDNVADLTLGTAMSGTFDIPDDYWEGHCPYEKFMNEKDSRTRALLFLLAELQKQLKTIKGRNAYGEMLLRNELCGHFEKQIEKQAKEHRDKIKKMEKEFEDDLNKQLAMQKEQLERQYMMRGDPSLLRFESNEKSAEIDALNEEITALKERIEELEGEKAS